LFDNLYKLRLVSDNSLNYFTLLFTFHSSGKLQLFFALKNLSEASVSTSQNSVMVKKLQNVLLTLSLKLSAENFSLNKSVMKFCHSHWL